MNILQKHLEQLYFFNNQRRAWLFLSAFVATAIMGILYEWRYIESSRIMWAIGSAGLIVTMSWWYWTMRLIRGLIEFKVDEAKILADIVLELKEIKKNINHIG